MASKLMLEAKPARQSMVEAKPITPMKIRSLGSTFLIIRATIGDITMANTPLGATAKPAQLAV